MLTERFLNHKKKINSTYNFYNKKQNLKHIIKNYKQYKIYNILLSSLVIQLLKINCINYHYVIFLFLLLGSNVFVYVLFHFIVCSGICVSVCGNCGAVLDGIMCGCSVFDGLYVSVCV